MADRSLYQPRLLRHHIRALYVLKEYTGLPMTHHIRLAVEQYVARCCEADAEGREQEPTSRACRPRD